MSIINPTNKKSVSHVFNQGALDYHEKVLKTPHDGSHANYQAKHSAVAYMLAWREKLIEFASASDTKVSKYCSKEAERIKRLINNVEKLDGIK